MGSAGSARVSTVHVIAKTHLDLGFTGLAAEVEARYLADLFPRALAVAAELEVRGGPARLCWTTGSWILHRALTDRDQERAEAVAAGVVAGHLAWHALPLTFHTELMDVALVRSGLAIGAELDARFGRRTTAAKMTDVPGHTRGLVPLLAEAGVTFLHLGVNPAWPVPGVPPVFRWRSPDGAEVVVAYQAGGYGGVVEVQGCPDVLAFLHAGDNLGPPSADEVEAAFTALQAAHPGAEVQASTLDAYARALAASGAVEGLPVVTAEIGDPWVFGAASDPQKVAAYRRLLRERLDLAADLGVGARTEADRRLLLVAEHTWGLDQKVVLPHEPPWDAEALDELRSTEVGRRFEASWAEQRAYVATAAHMLSSQSVRSFASGDHDRPNLSLGPVPPVLPDAGGDPLGPYEPVEPGSPLPPREFAGPSGVDSWRPEIAIDPASGALVGWRAGGGRVLADTAHPLGLITHQTFDAADYERFYAQLQPTAADEWWARRDNTKPGIDGAGARSERRTADAVAVWVATDPAVEGPQVVVCLRFHSTGAGAAPVVWLGWTFSATSTAAHLQVWWPDKPATRLPEATWCSFVPPVAEPERWLLDKLGQQVSPLDVVRRGGRSLHAVGEGMVYDGADGPLRILTPDAPLVAPGAPNLLDADPPVPDLAGGFHVLLHDNCWGTNFPMWSEGAAAFSFTIEG
jgi:hypothetical protein